jgi:hypothetical protein
MELDHLLRPVLPGKASAYRAMARGTLKISAVDAKDADQEAVISAY